MQVEYRLNAGEVAENWRLSTRNVVNLARSQVYHTERPPLHVRRGAARRAGLSATADASLTGCLNSWRPFMLFLAATEER